MNCTDNKLRLGIDIGSTTVKVVVVDDDNKMVFKRYKRHYSEIKETLLSLLEDANRQLGNVKVAPVITGSGGVALSNLIDVPFVQEVVATAVAVDTAIPKTNVAIELGG